MATSKATRHPCGTLAKHEPHEWTGQTTRETLACPGQPPVKPYGVRVLSDQPWRSLRARDDL